MCGITSTVHRTNPYVVRVNIAHVGKCSAGLEKTVPSECINYAARLCSSSTMDPLKSFAVRAWLRFGAEGIDSIRASLGAFVRNGSTQNKLLELCINIYILYEYNLYCGWLLFSQSSLRALRLGTVLFLGLWISFSMECTEDIPPAGVSKSRIDLPWHTLSNSSFSTWYLQFLVHLLNVTVCWDSHIYHPCPVLVYDHYVGLVCLCLLVTGCWSPTGSQACHFGLGTDVCQWLVCAIHCICCSHLHQTSRWKVLDGLRGFLTQSGVFCGAVDPCHYWSGAECLWLVLLRFPGSAVSSNRRDFTVSVTFAICCHAMARPVLPCPTNLY